MLCLHRTGSLLVAAAKFGSYVCGSDIDYLMLHAKTKPSRVRQKVREKDESIKANLIQYGLQHLYIDVFVADFSNCPLTDSICFDSIITDRKFVLYLDLFHNQNYSEYLKIAPYGIREKMEQVVAKEGKKSTVLNEGTFHFPSSSPYAVKQMYEDLLKFSAKHLKLGGRLVCFFPVLRKDYHEKILPNHSAFELVGNSEQKLNSEATRRLLTYEKVRDAGEILASEGLEELDFRVKYFSQNEVSNHERRVAIHQRNVSEAQKRGKHIDSNFESRKKVNKNSEQTILLESEERN